jgi:hypothetical protein
VPDRSDEEQQARATPRPVSSMPPDPHRLPPAGEWFASDAAHHLLDKPMFCPNCAAALERGLVAEWWSGRERMFLTWCAECKWTGSIVLFDRAIIEEPEH